MEYKELLAAFAAKYGIEGLDGADGTAELDVDGIRVELLEDPPSRCALACAEIGIDTDNSNGLKINGGTVVSFGSAAGKPVWAVGLSFDGKTRQFKGGVAEAVK